MAVSKTVKKTNYRLFKVASELNIGKETIVEFLHRKGFDIPDKPSASLDQEMFDLVMKQFQEEHRQAEKQRKKFDAYHDKRVRAQKEKPAKPAAGEEAEAPAPATETAPEAAQEVPAVEEQPVEAPVEEVPSEETSVVESAEEVEEKPKKAPARKKNVDEEAEPVEAVEPVEEPAREEPPVAEEPAEPVEAPVEAVTPPAEEPPQPVEVPEQAEAAAPKKAPARRKVAATKQEEKEVNVEAAKEEGTTEAVTAEEKQKYAPGAPKLKGLTVVDKIDLPTQKAAAAGKDKRRKRKRIRESVTSADIPSSTAATTTGTRDRRRKRRGGGVQVDQEQVAKAIQQTRARMGDTGSGGSARQKRSRQRREEREERAQRRLQEEIEQETILTVTEYVTVADLANLMDVDVAQVISKCIGLGLMVSINQRLDKETIELVADEFGFTVEFQEDYAEDLLAEEEDEPESLKPRAPIVTIMGHVDHGKTSLLDYIRSASVVAGEAGGITQHIGAYSVTLPDGRNICFLDTPGHEAFTAMRARGAQITDIVVLVVAADDSVMPQTIEAISHAQAAGVPMVIAINKVDKPDANPERIKQQLSDHGVLVESWGGKYQSVEISAKAGTNVETLLDTILLEAEVLDLKANPDRNARGVIIEAEIDKGKGTVATVLVQKGTLKVGDNFVAGQHAGRVRALYDERGRRLDEAGPSKPAQVLGLSGVPTAGDAMVVLDSEQDTREIATRRQQLRREQEFKQVRHTTLDQLSSQIARGGVQNLALIIKGDVDGSVEALADSLLKLSTSEVQVSVVMKGVGEISESDVNLAAASDAVIIGFHVRPNLKARKLAEQEGVEIRTYQIIYDTVNDVRAALEGMLRPEEKEEVTGTAEVRDIFKISRIGTIAGCYVLDGRITRNDRIRLLRDGMQVFDGSIESLRRVKEDVREVEQGFECGISLEGMNDIKVGDVIEAYRTVEIKRKLESVASSF